VSVEYVKQGFNSRSFINRLSEEEPDYLLLLGCSQILDEEVIQIPTKEVINFHWAKLPSYRGRNATFWPVYNGDSETGITFHSITTEIDQGSVFLQRSVEIGEDDDRHTVSYKCLRVGKLSLSQLLEQINNNDINAESEIIGGEYYSIKDFERIVFDPLETANENLRRISAKGELLIEFTNGTELLATNMMVNADNIPGNAETGEIISIDRDGIHIVVNDGVVTITHCYYIPSIIVSKLKLLRPGLKVKVGRPT